MPSLPAPAAPSLAADEAGVSPVIGTILILAITVAGIGVALFWGVPVMQRLRDQADLQAMTSQMLEVREATMRLAGADSGRSPGVSLPSGELRVEEATRLMVTVNHDTGVNLDCDFHVTGWEDEGDAGADGIIAWTSQGCRAVAVEICLLPPCDPCTFPTCTPCPAAAGCFVLYEVQGGELTPMDGVFLGTQFVPLTAMERGTTYVVRLESPDGSTVYTEAWILDGQRITWQKDSSEGGAELNFEWGALFSRLGSARYQAASPRISEGAFSSEDVFIRVPQLEGAAVTALTSTGTHAVLLRQSETHMRPDGGADDTYRIRYDFFGDTAEAWCNTLLLRNTQWDEDRYLPDDDALLDTQDYCAGGEDSVVSVSYKRDADGDGVAEAGDEFDFRFQHGFVQASLQI